MRGGTLGTVNRKVMDTTSFAPVLNTSVDMLKVNSEVICRWVSERITEILGFEDEVVIGLVNNVLTGSKANESGTASKPTVAGRRGGSTQRQLDSSVSKKLQIDLTGFLDKARIYSPVRSRRPQILLYTQFPLL